jgi:hypothetical protein
MFTVKVNGNIIEFYDETHKTEKHRLGQFVSSYYKETLMSDKESLVLSGMSLYGGIPAWSLSPYRMKTVFDKLELNETLFSI